MKAFMYFMVMAAGFASHAAINSKANSACGERKNGILWEATASAEEAKKAQPVRENSAPAPVQQAAAPAKAQGT